jgi:hypothetical protein
VNAGLLDDGDFAGLGILLGDATFTGDISHHLRHAK